MCFVTCVPLRERESVCVCAYCVHVYVGERAREVVCALLKYSRLRERERGCVCAHGRKRERESAYSLYGVALVSRID